MIGGIAGKQVLISLPFKWVLCDCSVHLLVPCLISLSFLQANYAHGGYVAITPGAKHVAPLPYPGASHHVNLAKAPGTQ